MNKKILIGIVICLVLVGGLAIAEGVIGEKENKEKWAPGEENLAIEYEEYVLTNMKYDAEIVGMERDIHSPEIHVFWRVQIYDEEFYDEVECAIDEKTMEENCQIVTKVRKDILHDETFSSKVLETAKDNEIEDTIKIHARDWINSWRPPLKVSVDNRLIGEKLDLA